MSLRTRALALLAIVLLMKPAGARAQSVDVTPLFGYRFGGGFFEQVTNQPVDLDGAHAFGAAVDIPFRDDLFVEVFFTHQPARFSVPATATSPRTRWRITVDHWQVGGLRELRDYGSSRARPFLTGSVGLTRFGDEEDDEVRFSVAAGGGVFLMPTRRVGLRLDGRAFVTLLGIGSSTILCRPGVCLVAAEASAVWQAEFTAGLRLRF